MTELVKLLFACGIVPLPRAKVLGLFIKSTGREVTARELERECDLRQPEVSLALSAFIDKKWISVTQRNVKEGKGRPTKVYVLAVQPEHIYTGIAKTVESDYKTKSGLLEKLKSAMISPKPVVSEGSVKKEQQLQIESPLR